jgi:Holliday junction resolvase RusA-like endonuclease
MTVSRIKRETGEAMADLKNFSHGARPAMCGWVGGTPRSGQTAKMARGRVLSWAAAGKQSKVWREKLERDFRLSVEDMGGADAVREAFKGCKALGLHLVFTFGTCDRAKFGTEHTSRPDADNLQKVVLDVAKKAGLFGGRDDAAVSRVDASKVWGALPGLAWSLTALTPQGAGGTGHVVERGVAELPEWMVD